MNAELSVATQGPGLYEFTQEVEARLPQDANGLLTLFVRHTSCSILVQENADPDVRRDLQSFFERLAPPATAQGMEWITHRIEGPDDMPAHIRAAVLPVSLSIPVSGGRLGLGRWQGIYLVEHRDTPHRRTVALHLSG